MIENQENILDSLVDMLTYKWDLDAYIDDDDENEDEEEYFYRYAISFNLYDLDAPLDEIDEFLEGIIHHFNLDLKKTLILEEIKLNVKLDSKLTLENLAKIIKRHYGDQERKKVSLHHVADMDIEAIKAAIDSGADVNEKDRCGNTPLHLALEEPAKVRLLLESSANINAKDKEGNTALMWAVQTIDMESVKLLIENGADLNLRNRFGLNAANEACRYGDIEILKILIENTGDIESKATRSNEGMTNLMLASMYGHKELVTYLVDKGADINGKNKDGFTALKFASQGEHQKIVEYLTGQTADLNEKNK